MSLTTYRKKPVFVEAIQVTKENANLICEMFHRLYTTIVPWFGCWIVKEPDGSWSVVSLEVFEKEYEVV